MQQGKGDKNEQERGHDHCAYGNYNNRKSFMQKIQNLRRSNVRYADHSDPLTVFARLNAGIVVSNPIPGMDVSVYSVFVLGSGLATG
jgi:hypothetical protein